MVKLIVNGDERALCTQRVLILLEELELKYSFKRIDLSKREHKTDEYLLLNPFGVVPVVEYGERKLFESRAILRYIARANRDTQNFLGDVNVDMWLEAEGHHFNPHISKIVYEKLWKGSDPDEALIEKELEHVDVKLAVYNNQLEGKEFIAGDTFSIADIAHIPYAYAFLKCGYKDAIKKHINVYNWLKRIIRREAVRRVLDGTFMEDVEVM